MDTEYQRRLILDEFVVLEKRIADENWPVTAELIGTTTFLYLEGRGGSSEPYQIKIAAGQYPVSPWRISFIDPSAKGQQQFIVPDHDPRYWPFSTIPGLHGGFHVSYPGPYRVFVCRPFTEEYFYYHSDEPWQPHVFRLHRVVAELREALTRAEHFSRWWTGLLARIEV